METNTTPASAAAAVEECWSVDEEDYNATSLAELLENHGHLAPGMTVWKGAPDRPSNSSLCDANDVIDMMADRAHDIAGEYADDYPRVNHEARVALDLLLSDWIDKHAPPGFYTVTDIKPYVLTPTDFESEPNNG